MRIGASSIMQQPGLWGFAAIVAGTPSPLSSILTVDPEVGCVATEAGLSFHGNARGWAHPP